CAYAVMSNHYHIVVRINQQQALGWSDREVAERWMQLFSGPLIVKRWLKGETKAAEGLRAQEIVDTWRARLHDLGWFMKCLNEHLARKANEEDCCKGRFWESRYKCQALLDDKALLQCMAYVDLNPVRAGMADTLESSDYTSIKQRSEKIQSSESMKVPALLPMVNADNTDTTDDATVCRFRLMDYLELVDSTGRAVRDDKRGSISVQAAGVLDRLGIDEGAWLANMKPRKRRQPIAMGTLEKLKEYAQNTGRKWVAGQSLVVW
ncbi:MAG: transposase, partial [Alcanivorax sp.]|nr:transposase [Alcanivorax sp.]